MYAEFRALGGNEGSVTHVLVIEAWGVVRPASASRLNIDLHGDKEEFRALYETLKKGFEGSDQPTAPAPAAPR